MGEARPGIHRYLVVLVGHEIAFKDNPGRDFRNRCPISSCRGAYESSGLNRRNESFLPITANRTIMGCTRVDFPVHPELAWGGVVVTGGAEIFLTPPLHFTLRFAPTSCALLRADLRGKLFPTLRDQSTYLRLSIRPKKHTFQNLRAKFRRRPDLQDESRT